MRIALLTYTNPTSYIDRKYCNFRFMYISWISISSWITLMSVPLSPLPGRDRRPGCLLYSILDCIALVVMQQVLNSLFFENAKWGSDFSGTLVAGRKDKNKWGWKGKERNATSVPLSMKDVGLHVNFAYSYVEILIVFLWMSFLRTGNWSCNLDTNKASSLQLQALYA